MGLLDAFYNLYTYSVGLLLMFNWIFGNAEPKRATIIKRKILCKSHGGGTATISERKRAVSYQNLGAVLCSMGITHRLHDMMTYDDETGRTERHGKRKINYQSLPWHKNKVTFLVGAESVHKNSLDTIKTYIIITRV